MTLYDDAQNTDWSTARITQKQLQVFDRRYFAGEFGSQRYGQAVINELFHGLDPIRQDHVLWEAKNNQVALNRLHELNRIEV